MFIYYNFNCEKSNYNLIKIVSKLRNLFIQIISFLLIFLRYELLIFIEIK